MSHLAEACDGHARAGNALQHLLGYHAVQVPARSTHMWSAHLAISQNRLSVWCIGHISCCDYMTHCSHEAAYCYHDHRTNAMSLAPS